MTKESYTLADFTTENWWFRPPHDGSTGIDFESLVEIHKESGTMIHAELDHTSEFWFAVHLDHVSFTVYIYQIDGWNEWPAIEGSTPFFAWPMFLVIGTTFDGCRETQGCPTATSNLGQISAAALAVDLYIKGKGWVL